MMYNERDVNATDNVCVYTSVTAESIHSKYFRINSLNTTEDLNK